MAWIFFLAVSFLLSPCMESKVIPPESMNVMFGEEATFSCAGESLAIAWTINNTNIASLGIEATDKEVDGVPTSYLTINGSMENNNISIQCVLVVGLDVLPLSLPPVYLTVLGIGPASEPYLTLASSPTHANTSCIQWEEPVFKSADVTDLMYNVSLSGADLSPITITTSETQHCPEPELTPCQEYNITVTPFSTSPGYTGSSNTATDSAFGDNYHLEGNCTLAVKFADTNSVSCSFACQVRRPPIPCPLQCLHVVTNIVADNDSNVSPMNSSLFLDDETSVVINITGLLSEKQYYSNFSILDKDGSVVDNGNTSNFGTYSIQNASFSHLTNTSNISVTCTFAFNAPASACFVLFENSSLGLDFNGTVPHPFGLLRSSGVVDIPQNILEQGVMQKLNGVAFDAKVYDVYMNGEIMERPAFEQKGALEIELDVAKPNPDMSTYIIGTSTSVLASASPPAEQDHEFEVWIVIATSVVIVVMAVVAVVVLCLFLRPKYYLCKHKCELSKRCDVQCEIRTDTSTAPAEEPYVEPKSYVTISHQQDSFVAVETSSNTITPELVVGEARPCKPVHHYVPIKPVQMKPVSGDSHYADLGPRPVDAPKVLPELDGEKVVYSDIKKHTTEYAVLGDIPANAPPVLPPEQSVVYSDVSTAKHTILQGSTAFIGMEATISASSVSMHTPEKRCLKIEDGSDTPWEQEPEVQHDLEAQGIPIYGKQNVITSLDGSSSAYRSIGTAGQNVSVMIFPVMSSTPEVSEPTLCSSCDAETTMPCLVFSTCFVPSFAWKCTSKKGNCFESLEQDENEPCLNIESRCQDCDYEGAGELIIADEHHEKELYLMMSENHYQEVKRVKAVESIVEPNSEAKSINSSYPFLCVLGDHKPFAPISVWFLFSCFVSILPSILVLVYDPGINFMDFS